MEGPQPFAAREGLAAPFFLYTSFDMLADVPADLPAPYAALESGPSTLRFFRADCVELLRALPAASVSVVVTSPPYNLGVGYRTLPTTRCHAPSTWSGPASGSPPPHGRSRRTARSS